MFSVIGPVIGAIFIAYLIGAISFSYLAGKLLKGIDLRQYGSGNLGASNALRTLGRWQGIIVLLLDILKGYVAVYIAYRVGGGSLANDDTLALLGVLAGLAAILGHIFTLYHGFKGGKGIATSLGVFIYLAPISITISFGVWLIVFLFTRYISLGSIAAATTLPLCMLAQRYIFSQEIPGILLGLSILISAVIIIKHTPNIQRLLAGKENRFEWK